MKKYYLTAFLLAALAGTPAYSQNYRHELRAGIGIGNDHHLNSTQDQYINDFNLEEGSALDFGLGSWQTSAHLEYSYHINTRWAIGAVAGFASAKGNGAMLKWDDRFREEDPEDQNVFNYIINGVVYSLFGDTDIKLHSKSQFLMPVVQYSWKSKDKFRLYSKVGLGAQHYDMYVTSSRNSFPEKHENGIRLAYQLTPIGLETGGKRMRGYMELGYGKQGIINLGISYHL